MSNYQVPEPIINSPFEEPKQHWNIIEGEQPQLLPDRRRAVYFYRDPKAKTHRNYRGDRGVPIELKLVNVIRERVKAWREADYPGVTRTTHELLQWWRRDGRQVRLFFAQVEAAETVIFLKEARADFRQGIEIPRDEPGDEAKKKGYRGFVRYACKMATGTGKTTVMAMVAAWSVLNKLANRGDGRFSDAVLVVCPNVTIRDRLNELKPELGDASVYRTRDLVPEHLMPTLTQGRFVVTNWHVFEPQVVQQGGVSAKVIKSGTEERKIETIIIGPKKTSARGHRYLTPQELTRQIAAGLLTVLEEDRDKSGALKRVKVESVRYVKSDTALIDDVLGRDIGGKQNLLVLNDEAHHAYRIRRPEPEEEQEEAIFGEEEEAEEFFKEATVWVDGLDKVHKLRTVNFCVDFSATPYFLGRVGQAANRPFPWVVSDFGLIDAIESGLVTIPQLAVRDTTGAAIPGYFNIWHWILPQLTSAERGGKKARPKPEAILKYAHHPIAMLGSLWEKELHEVASRGDDPRPPVFILVCKDTPLAKVVYEWLAENKCPTGIPPSKIEGFRNNGTRNTIRVDSKVVHETDSDQPMSDEVRWMRFTLDTVGKLSWPKDRLGRPIYPSGFEELAKKREEPLHPPGRDVRCIVSVAMLTEGWDCNRVTHIVGLRPFMSQLLCEQVVGRGLRRKSYELTEDGKFPEEVAKVFGVPFEVIPFKAAAGPAPKPIKRYHVHAIPEKSEFAIKFPRVEGYTQAIRNRVTVNWKTVPSLTLDPLRIPPEVEVKGLSVSNGGKLSLSGPGRIDDVRLAEFRAKRRVQELTFDLAAALTDRYVKQPFCEIPSHVLFPQLASIVGRYVKEKVRANAPADKKDLFLAPYYGWLVEVLLESIRPDTSQGETPELPVYEPTRGPGSTADVDFWTSREVFEVRKSHLNYVVADTRQWEQSAAFHIDKSPAVRAFVKNASLGFAIPYLYNGQMHDYLPDFIIRFEAEQASYLVLEVKGYDPLEEVKSAAAQRWTNAVNADGRSGKWQYALIKKVSDIESCLKLESIALKMR
jgi:type III restriction enzyme